MMLAFTFFGVAGGLALYLLISPGSQKPQGDDGSILDEIGHDPHRPADFIPGSYDEGEL